MLAESNKLLSDASAILAANDGREVQAMILVDDALRKMSEASRMVPSEQVLQEWRDRYNELNKHVKEQRATHKKQYDSVVAEKGAKAAVAYDSKEVESILTEAQTLYQKENFQDAIKRVEEADMLVTAALNEMMKSQTVMYKLNLDTPEGEYKYEYDAYLGYVELVPVALEEKQPSDEQRKLFDNFVSKAEDMHKRAGELAKQGNYPDAISVIRAATTQMRNGLRLLGVQQ